MESVALTNNSSSTSEQDEQAKSVGEFVQAKQIDENDRGERNVAGCKRILFRPNLHDTVGGTYKFLFQM